MTDEREPDAVVGEMDEPQASDVTQDGCPVDRSSHLTQVNDPRAVDATMSVLDPSDTRPLRCVPTDGLVGPLVPVPPR